MAQAVPHRRKTLEAPPERARDSRGRQEPHLVLGQPLTAWAFALRIWLAMSAGLAAAFWLQLDSPSSAMVTVAILALPRRGQASSKAFYRAAATVVGFLASIILTALFAQTQALLLVTCAAWIALAVYVGALQDGNRSYGAVLAGYTVANISIQNIDAPQTVFSSGIDRVAVILVGIVALQIINDALTAPSVVDDLRQRLRSAAAEVVGVARATASGAVPSAGRVLSLLARIVAMRPDIEAVPNERATGPLQAGAARSAVAAMLSAVAASRMLALTAPATGAGEASDDLTAALAEERPSACRIMRAQFAADMAGQLALDEAELDAMDSGRAPSRTLTLPIHRPRKDALRKAIRIFIILVAGSVLLAATNWPGLSLGLTTLSVLAGLSAGVPSAKAFAKSVLIGVPLAIIVAGLTKFILLDGSDSLPLLMLATAPAVFVGCFMLGHPRTAGSGYILLVFIGIVLSPTNPQTYNPHDFLVSALLIEVAAVVLAIAVAVTLPTTDKMQRHWIVEQLQDDLADVRVGQAQRAPAEMIYLAVDRMTQLHRLEAGAETVRNRRLEQAMLLSLLILACARARAVLRSLAALGQISAGAAFDAQDALARMAPAELDLAALALADQVRSIEPAGRADLARAVADLAFLGIATRVHARTLRHLRPIRGLIR